MSRKNPNFGEQEALDISQAPHPDNLELEPLWLIVAALRGCRDELAGIRRQVDKGASALIGLRQDIDRHVAALGAFR